jgi:transcriptional regulator with XRE-family HTH domain
MNENIGLHLKKLRVSCGYSLREAAKISRLSHGYIRDVEIGANNKSGNQIVPMPQTLRKFAHAYRADFNNLMRIAGHFEVLDTEKIPYHLIEVDINSVLFVQVNCENRVNYHLVNDVYIEEKSLHEFMILEQKLEINHFLRVHSGIYVNLNQIYAFDEKNGRIYFDEKMSSKYVDITWNRTSKFRSTIKQAISRNTNTTLEIKLSPKQQIFMVVRNISE